MYTDVLHKKFPLELDTKKSAPKKLLQETGNYDEQYKCMFYFRISTSFWLDLLFSQPGRVHDSSS